MTTDGLASAALAVIDRDGLAGLTMRAVAAELSLTTMAVYRYVADRDELESLVVEGVLRELETSPPEVQPWTEQLRILAERVHATVGAHPGVVPLLVSHRHRSTGILRWSETVVGILADAGLSGSRRVIALRGLLSYVIGALQMHHLGSLAGEGTAMIAGLADFPRLAETGRQARGVTPDQEFAGGLAILLRGLAG